MATIPVRPATRISRARMSMTAAISAVGRQAMPRKRIHATIGAVMLNVTTVRDSSGQSVHGSDEPNWSASAK